MVSLGWYLAGVVSGVASVMLYALLVAAGDGGHKRG